MFVNIFQYEVVDVRLRYLHRLWVVLVLLPFELAVRAELVLGEQPLKLNRLLCAERFVLLILKSGVCGESLLWKGVCLRLDEVFVVVSALVCVIGWVSLNDSVSS